GGPSRIGQAIDLDTRSAGVVWSGPTRILSSPPPRPRGDLPRRADRRPRPVRPIPLRRTVRMAMHPAMANRLVLGLLALAATARPAAAAALSGLPRYDLAIDLDTARHLCTVRQQVVWTNRHQRPAAELVFNAHSHYQLPAKEVGMTAKIFE